MILYRPLGPKELALIIASGYTAFPARLPEQPVFYPVLNFQYAEQIARDWNATIAPYAGFVTRFEVDQRYAENFEIHTVGGKIHQELWVLAEELPEFNQHIQGKIDVVAVYYGDRFSGDREIFSG